MKGKYFVFGIGILVLVLAGLYFVSIRHIEKIETVYTGPAHKIDTAKTFSGAQVHNLNLSADGAHIRIMQGLGQNITVHAYGNYESPNSNSLTFQTSVKDSTLTIVLQQANLSIRGKENLTLDVEVPAQTFGLIQIQSITGAVDFGKVQSDSTKIATSSGLVTADGAKTSLTVSVDNGAVRVMNVAGKLNLKTGNGSIIVHEKTIQNNISAYADIGSVLIDTKSGGENVRFTLTTQVGSIFAKLPNQRLVQSEPGNVAGYVGQGGPLVDVSANDGTVTLTAS